MAIEIDAAEQGEDQGHAQQAEHLEVDPHLLGEVEGHVEVEQTAQGEEADPAEIDVVPDPVGAWSSLPSICLMRFLPKP